MIGTEPLDQIEEAWAVAFVHAQRRWSPVLDLPALRFCRTPDDEREAGLDHGFIRVRHTDRSITVSLRRMAELGLDAEPDAVLAHGIGHLVVAPGDLAHHARLLARIRAGLAEQKRFAPVVANLWTDLIVDHRLRLKGFATIDPPGKATAGPLSPILRLQLRASGILAGIPEGHLVGPETTAASEGTLDLDARLAARLVLVHQNDWLAGSAPFARLAAPYVADSCDPRPGERLLLNPDLVGAVAGPTIPAGMAQLDRGELDPLQPIHDPRITGQRKTRLSVERAVPATSTQPVVFRTPAEYLDLMEALGITRPRPELVAQFYRERVRPLRGGLRHTADPAPDLVLGLIAPSPAHDPGGELSSTSLFAAVRALEALRAGATVAVDWSAPDGNHRPAVWFDANEQSVLELLTTPPSSVGRPGLEQIHSITELVANHDHATEVLLLGDETLGPALGEVAAGWLAVEQLADMSPSTIVLRDAGRWWRASCRAFARRGWRVHHIHSWDELTDLASGLPDPLTTTDLLGRSTESAIA